MKLLLIDNYDSFTYNLFHQLARVSGCLPRVAHHDAIDLAEIHAYGPDLIVISPGPGRPERPSDFGICAAVLAESRWPVLGVCLGYQGLAWHHGARVDFAPQVMHGRLSHIRHDGSGLFAGLPQAFEVVRYHSLVVAEPLPPELEALAWAEDGVLMALRHRQLPRFGIQFHPESICTEHGDRLIANALALAGIAPRPQARPVAAAPRPRATLPTWTDCIEQAPPAEWVHAACYATREQHFWLDNSLDQGPGPRFSYMGAPEGDQACVLRYNSRERRLTLCQNGREEVLALSIFEYLERALARPVDTGLPFPFIGGYVGYFGYELKGELGSGPGHASPWPDAALLRTDRYLVFDHGKNRLYLVSHDHDQLEAQRWFRSMRTLLAELVAPVTPPPQRPVDFVLEKPGPDYLSDIATCEGHLHDGESYEICLTNRWRGTSAEDPAIVYRRLRRLNPAPYAACLRFGPLWVLSSSPEQFLGIDASGQVSTKPIKGTRARLADPAADQAVAEDLRQAVKERSENLMIVDLLRNDLGRVCEVGSVHVPHLMEVERYATVHQLVSTVRGQLRTDASAIDCLRASFPGGSMTGAPKLRTMELIDALETSARGIYSGCIGYLGLDGAAELSIVIRTAVVEHGQVTIGTGGAVVALSDAQAELDEMLLKARVVQQAFCG